MTPEQYRRLGARFARVLDLTQSEVDSESLECVHHYVDHAEIEMAFEILCLGLIKSSVRLPPDLAREIESLARELGLDSASVFDAELWPKLQCYVNVTVDKWCDDRIEGDRTDSDDSC